MAIFYWLLYGLKWKCWRIYNFCCNLFWVYGFIDWTNLHHVVCQINMSDLMLNVHTCVTDNTTYTLVYVISLFLN